MGPYGCLALPSKVRRNCEWVAAHAIPYSQFAIGFSTFIAVYISNKIFSVNAAFSLFTHFLCVSYFVLASQFSRKKNCVHLQWNLSEWVECGKWAQSLASSLWLRLSASCAIPSTPVGQHFRIYLLIFLFCGCFCAVLMRLSRILETFSFSRGFLLDAIFLFLFNFSFPLSNEFGWLR